MDSPWPIGINAPKQLKDELAAFIETLRPGFPEGYVHVFVGNSQGTKKQGVMVELYSQADAQTAHQYYEDLTGRQVLEEYHRIAIDVKADDKAGGDKAAEPIYEIIKGAVLSTPGREALIAKGVFDVREMPEAPEYGDVEFTHPLHLTCNTDKYLT